MPLDKPRPVECPLRIVFPKVNTTAEPVIIIVAGNEVNFPGENLLTESTVASVIAEDELAGGLAMKNRRPVAFGQLPSPCDKPGFYEELAQSLFVGLNLSGKTPLIFDHLIDFVITAGM